MDFQNKVKLYLAGGALALVALTGYSTAYNIDATEVGVVTRFGAVVRTQTPGLNFKIPYVEGLQTLPTTILALGTEDGKPANTYTVDNQEVDVSWKVFFRITPERAGYIVSSNPYYRERLLTVANDRIKAAMGQVNIQQLAGHRGAIRDGIEQTLHADAASLGLEVTDFNLADLGYDKKFREAVSEAAVKKANIERAEYERQQAEKDAQKAKVEATGKADAVREAANGAADARLANAKAEAQAIDLEGAATARAVKLKNEALKSAPDLVEYTKASRWNGQLPQTMLGQTMPFMQVGPGGVASPLAH